MDCSHFDGAHLSTVRIWTDAMYEDGKPCMISTVAYFPPYEERPDDEYVEYYHMAPWRCQHPSSFMKKFVERKGYKGQLELLPAVVTYTTLAEQLRDRKVVHMIDNQSAVAALIKGYTHVRPTRSGLCTPLQRST